MKGILVPPPNNNIYLLCAGAFTYNDYRACGYYRDKAFKWGYFPETKYYDNVEALISQKEPASILWAGRCIDWKHPELAVLLAEKLRAENLPFTMTIIGQGNMSEEIARLVHERKLDECVNLPGALPPEEVRRYMERSQIFLFTSDRHEGWGCVLNEAMNSGCAVVAGEKIGAVPYLLKHGKNGLVFRDRDIDDLTLKVRELLMKPAQIAELGRNACRTITEEWSPRIAAERFVKLQESLSRGEGRDIFAEGPCSMAGYSV